MPSLLLNFDIFCVIICVLGVFIMFNLTFDEFNSIDFKLFEFNPTVRRSGLSFVVADPSILPPDKSPNGKWNMFCHTFFGVERYTSSDCITWNRLGIIATRAMRPNINYIDGKYYLYYERVLPFFKKALTVIGAKKWHSEIYLITSDNLVNWSKPQPIIQDTTNYTHDELGVSISNPFLLEVGGKKRLYFSAGQTFIKDCGFSEPTYISYAESDSLTEGFIPLEKPILSPDKNNKYLNLCCGCLKVYKLKDAYIGLQNGIYLDEENHSHSAIMLLKSTDGVKFEFIKPLIEPQLCKHNKKWMAQFVYACCLNYDKDSHSFFIHFNARNTSNIIFGREHIGYAIGKIGEND